MRRAGRLGLALGVAWLAGLQGSVCKGRARNHPAKPRRSELCFSAETVPPLVSRKCLHLHVKGGGETWLARKLGELFPGFFRQHRLLGVQEAGRGGPIYPFSVVAAHLDDFATDAQQPLRLVPARVPSTAESFDNKRWEEPARYGDWSAVAARLHDCGYALLQWPAEEWSLPVDVVRAASKLFTEPKFETFSYKDPVSKYFFGYSRRHENAAWFQVRTTNGKPAFFPEWLDTLPAGDLRRIPKLLEAIWSVYEETAEAVLKEIARSIGASAGVLSQILQRGEQAGRVPLSHNFITLYRYGQRTGSRLIGLGSHVDVGTLSVTHFDFSNASHSIEFLIPLQGNHTHVALKLGDRPAVDVNVTRWKWTPLKEAVNLGPSPGCCLLLYAGESLSYMTSGSIWPLFHRVSLTDVPRISFPWFHRIEGSVDMTSLQLHKQLETTSPTTKSTSSNGQMLMKDFFRLTNRRIHVKKGWDNLDIVN